MPSWCRSRCREPPSGCARRASRPRTSTSRDRIGCPRPGPLRLRPALVQRRAGTRDPRRARAGRPVPPRFPPYRRERGGHRDAEGAADYLPKGDLSASRRRSRPRSTAAARAGSAPPKRSCARARRRARHPRFPRFAHRRARWRRPDRRGESGVVGIQPRAAREPLRQRRGGRELPARAGRMRRAGRHVREGGRGGVRAVMAREKCLRVPRVPALLRRRHALVPGARHPFAARDDGVVISHTDITDRMMAHVAIEQANKGLQTISKRVLAMQEEERRAISAELHDDVGQSLSALKIGLHRLAQESGRPSAAALGMRRGGRHDARTAAPDWPSSCARRSSTSWASRRRSSGSPIASARPPGSPSNAASRASGAGARRRRWKAPAIASRRKGSTTRRATPRRRTCASRSTRTDAAAPRHPRRRRRLRRGSRAAELGALRAPRAHRHGRACAARGRAAQAAQHRRRRHHADRDLPLGRRSDAETCSRAPPRHEPGAHPPRRRP